MSGAVRLGFLLVTAVAWAPAGALAYALGDSQVWLAMGLAALGGVCAGVAILAPASGRAASDEHATATSSGEVAAGAAVVAPVPAAEPAVEPAPPIAGANDPPRLSAEAAAWVAAAEAAMRPRTRTHPVQPASPAAVSDDARPTSAIAHTVVPPRGGDDEPSLTEAPGAESPVVSGAGAPAGEPSLDGRLRGLAARQRAHTADLRQSIRRSIDRQDGAEQTPTG